MSVEGFPCDVGGVGGGFSRFATFHGESGKGHGEELRFGLGWGYVVGGMAPSTARFLVYDRREVTRNH